MNVIGNTYVPGAIGEIYANSLISISLGAGKEGNTNNGITLIMGNLCG